ncbi:MAG: LPS-assembly protein LptD [Candidatus Cloacimonetes bacterium]|nr:LPS-assembly protein LptD [Candidatus Cloacimonadota bacterium]
MKRYVLILILLAVMVNFLDAEQGASAPVSILLDRDLESLSDSLKVEISDIAVRDSLFYSADSMRAYYKQEQIWLYGNTSVTYGTAHIQADSLFLDLKKEKARSLGYTQMRDGAQLLVGEDVFYDIKNQTGLLRFGHSYIEDGYYGGDEIRKVDGKVYDIDDGSFTTCDLAEPDYWFAAKQMRIYQHDKVVGKHVLAYVNHLPIFYVPFFAMSIKRGRHPGFLIPEPGYNNSDGKYVKDIAYYYPYKDLADFTVAFDIMEKTGWQSRVNADYIKRYYYTGSFRGGYQKNIRQGSTQNDWFLRANHHHDLPEKSSLDLSIDFISNKRIWEGSSLVDESLAQRLNSSLAYRKPIGNTYFNVGLLFNKDLINDRATVNLPSANWSVSTRPVYELLGLNSMGILSNLSYYYNVKLEHSGDIRDPDADFMDYIWANHDENSAESVEHHFGIKHQAGLSNSYVYKGWLNLRQSVDIGEAWYDRDKNDKNLARGSDLSASLNASFNLFGLKQFKQGKIRAVRHTITPTAGLSYLPDHTRNKDYYSFGAVSLRQNEKQSNLSFGLNQRWQIKSGESKTTQKVQEILSWNSSIAANLVKEEKKFGNISHSFAFNPGKFSLGSLGNELWKLSDISLGYSNRLSLTQKTYEISFKDTGIRNQYFSQGLSLSGNSRYADYFPAQKNATFDSFGREKESSEPKFSDDGWSLDLTHDLSADKSLLKSTNQNLRMSASFYITKNYSVSYSNYYNLKDGELISQSFRLIRNLHCWKLDLSFTKRNEYWDYRLTFFNTKFPDSLKLQTRDSKRY